MLHLKASFYSFKIITIIISNCTKIRLLQSVHSTSIIDLQLNFTKPKNCSSKKIKHLYFVKFICRDDKIYRISVDFPADMTTACLIKSTDASVA